MHGRSHTRSAGMSIMRVDGRELPLSAIPLCQLFPCHLGPPRPTLSINLYVKGCLDCTSVPHVHTIGVFSPSEWGPDPQCQAAQVAHWTWWCGLTLQICLIIALSFRCRRHGALRSAHKSCTHGYVFWKTGGVKRELVADPWTSSRRFIHVLWLKVHSHLLLRVCLLSSKRKLPPQACQVRPGLPSVVCHPRGVHFPGTVYICSQGLFFKCLSPLHFLCTQCLQPLQKMLLLPTPVRQTAHGNSPELQEVQSRTADHNLCLSCIYSQSFLLHCFFPCQEPPDTFLKQFSDDNKVICIQVFPGDPRAELSW